MMFVLKYDYRTDGGPLLVGPFDSRVDANAHANTHYAPGWVAAYMIVPLATPEEDR